MNRVLSILAVVLTLGVLLPASAARADEMQLLFHQQAAGGHQVIHATSLVSPSPPPPSGPPSLEDQALHDSIQWLLTHQIFTAPELENFGFEATVTGDSIVIVASGAGGDIVIILSNGPIFPQPIPQDWLINVNVVRKIYNGF